MKGDEAKLRAAGCDGYLSKPIDVASFAAKVAAFLEPKAPFGLTRSDPYS